MWVYFWALYSVPLICVFVFITTLDFFWWLQLCSIFGNQRAWCSWLCSFSGPFLLFGYFYGPIQVLGLFVLFLWKIPSGILVNIALNLQTALGSMGILKILILSSMNMKYPSIYFCLLQYFRKYHNVQCTGLLPQLNF